ncbi:glycosyl hydrolases family 31-domain-containing protein [Suillus plorans]|uniref:Glycosyl hydrolases family 31-domain-containing protein n=1 Tax=Suillus plorans TaxID=116603 RepID=A0A9P7AFV9_9AGAM|nr:glycosyl hydrolases family 31-domain-containing protein [Suillus plorans]KAG1787972.1 glycosyl hydrolases family 31-domain-containing protein [Suillus plorans]
MVGADTCGFNDNINEESCNRWMQLPAFVSFDRNHNTYAALPQEPYRWESVANASRIVIAVRYSLLLPYWYTLFANSSMAGLPPVRALFYEFPDEPELFTVDRQWLVGSDTLATPVLTPGATTVDGVFAGSVMWPDWYTHAASHQRPHPGQLCSITASRAGYTIYETREGPYLLLTADTAFGTAYVDDGTSRTYKIEGNGEYTVLQKLEMITVPGVQKSTLVSLQGSPVKGWAYKEATEELVASNTSVNLNGQTTLVWK